MSARPSPPMETGRTADRLMAAAVALLLAGSAWRAVLADAAFGAYTDCRGCLWRPVLAQDLWLLAALVALFLLARWLGSRLLAAVIGLGAAALALAFAADLVVQQLLSRRLLLDDVLRYGGEVLGNLSVLAPLARTPAGAALLLGGLGLVVLAGLAVAAAPRQPRGRHAKAWTGLLAASLLLAWLQGPTLYLNRRAFENVLVTNRPDGMARPYGPATQAALAATPAPAPRCETGLARRQSVIVLVVESLSLHHSQLLSGLPGLTPRLDALAREGSHFPEFYANGFSTEGGLIALLTGAVPLPTLRRGGTLAFDQVHGDFHRRLAARGYRTRFFTTGTLGFGARDQWLRAIGITEAEGDEQPAYAGLPRGAFHAASDAALFGRFLAWYDHERDARPFVATVLTVGMHPPYHGRSDGAQGEAGTVRATDAAIDGFVRGLRERGFLREGLLLVVGDHRAMTPMQVAEWQRFGDSAMVRVPALVLGNSGLPPGPVAGAFQQTDLLPSLQFLLGERSCRGPLQGRMLGPDPIPAQVQLVADPMRYDRLRAFAGSREYVLELDGDDSRWLGPPLPGDYDLRLDVARQRLARDRAAAAD